MLHAAVGKSKESGCIPYIWRSGRDTQPSKSSHSESTSRDAASETSVLAERAPLTSLLHRETGETQVDRKTNRLSSMRACCTLSYQVQCTAHARLSFLRAGVAVFRFRCSLSSCFLFIFSASAVSPVCYCTTNPFPTTAGTAVVGTPAPVPTTAGPAPQKSYRPHSYS